MKKILIIIICLGFLFTACEIGISPSEDISSQTSSTTGNTEESSNTGELLLRGIEPGTKIVTLSGSSEEGESLLIKNIAYDGTDPIMKNLPPGSWTFHVNFTDGSGQVLAYGSQRVKIVRGERAWVKCSVLRPGAKPGQGRFVWILDDWFNPIFDAYGVPGDRESGGYFLRKATSRYLNFLLKPYRGNTYTEYYMGVMKRQGMAPYRIVEFLSRYLIPALEAYDPLDNVDWTGLYNEIFQVFQSNMLSYYNMVLFDMVPVSLEGIDANEIIASNDSVSVTAVIDGDTDKFDALWYLNGISYGSGFSVNLKGIDALEGENELTVIVSLQGIIMGKASVSFTGEKNQMPLTLAELGNRFPDKELYQYILDLGFTYPEEVTNLTYGDSANPTDTDLTGVELLIGLNTVVLDSLGLVTEDDISPLLSLQNVTFAVSKNNPLDSNALIALKAWFPGILIY